MVRASYFQLVKVLTSNFIGSFGSQVLSFGIGLYILQTTGSALHFSITILIGPLLTLLLTPVVGYVTDRFYRKAIIQTAQLCSVASLVIFFLFLQGGNTLSFIHIILLIIALSTCDKFLNISFTASIRSLVLDEHIQKTNSFLQVSSSTSMILAPVVGSILYATQSFSTFIIIVITTESLSFLINLFIDFRFSSKDKDTTPIQKESFWQSFRLAIVYIKEQKIILILISIAVSVNFLITAVFVGLPFVAVNYFQVSDFQFGMMEAGIAIGMFLMGILMGVIKESTFPLKNLQLGLVFIGILIISMSVPFLFQWTNGWITFYYLLINMLIGSTSTFINIPIMGILHKNIEESFKGRVFSVFFSGIQLFNPLGIFLFGVLFQVSPPAIIFVCVGIALLLTVKLAMSSFQHADRLYLQEKEVQH